MSASAIFLSYASQDADIARCICEALRAAGLEVWFDQSELRGGDAWDASIRKQIKECALFVPIISVNTNARPEGYFRLEWKLAVDRSHLMADDKAFFFPVVLDDVAEPTARVPDKFRERQWTRLNDDASTAAFAQRVAKLTGGSGISGKSASRSSSTNEFANSTTNSKTVSPDAAQRKSGAQFSSSTHGATNLDPSAVTKLSRDDSFTSGASGEQQTPSIAVLAFANRSASADDEYFSDGLADELLNVLAKIKGLRVAARTSAFSFKGKQTTVAEIGRILNVATVLEGSVRKSGNRVRISVQLVKVDDGFQLWGETYDRTLDDIFAVQDDIAQSVVKELRSTLLGERHAPEAKIAAEIAAATTARSENPEALRLCMQARFLREKRTDTELQAAIALYEQAIALDPTYAAAYSGLARALDLFASYGTYVGRDPMPFWARAKAAAKAAITHDPSDADAYLSLAHQAADIDRNMAEADRLIAKAFELNPNSVEVYRSQASQHMRRRQHEEMRACLLKALALDPLAMMTRVNLVQWAIAQHRNDEAEQMLNELKQMNPGWWVPEAHLVRLEQIKGNQSAASEHVFKWLQLRGNTEAAAFTRAELDAGGWQGYMRAAIADPATAKVGRAHLAYYHLVLGDKDAAFALLHESVSAHDESMWMIVADPRFEPLYDDPRYAELVKRTGFSE